MIKGFNPCSMLDWDGKVTAVIFIGGCNLRCPFCHNSSLVLNPDSSPTLSSAAVEKRIKEESPWLDGVVITGGEPLMDPNIMFLLKAIKQIGTKIKLDTNGTFPTVLKSALLSGFVDYVAVDVKAARGEYRQAIGVDSPLYPNVLKQTIEFLMSQGVPWEARTTLVPGMHTVESVNSMGFQLTGAPRWALQSFRADLHVIERKYAALESFTSQQMNDFLIAARKHVPSAFIRGA